MSAGLAFGGRPSPGLRTTAVVAPPGGRAPAAPAAERCSCGTAVDSSHGDVVPSGSHGSSGSGCSDRGRPPRSCSLASYDRTDTVVMCVSIYRESVCVRACVHACVCVVAVVIEVGRR